MAKLAALVCATLVLNGCASSKPTTSNGSTIGRDIDIERMSHSEAAELLREFRTKYGLDSEDVDVPQIASMAEVIEIIRRDRLGAFDAARSYTAGKKGPEALIIRAYLELSLASGMLTAAAILERERKEDLTELKQLEQPRSFGSAAKDTPEKPNRSRRSGRKPRTFEKRSAHSEFCPKSPSRREERWQSKRFRKTPTFSSATSRWPTITGYDAIGWSLTE